MKMLIYKTAALFLLVIASCCLIIIMPPVIDRSGNITAVGDKQARLAGIRSPKLILVGGSNLWFGVNSQKIERAIGRPVVNMAVSAGLGVAYELNQLRGNIKPGDIIIVSIEYYDGKPDFNYLRAALAVVPVKDELLDLSLSDKFSLLFNAVQGRVIDRIPNDLIRQTRKRPEAQIVYTRRGFDRYGDISVALGKPAFKVVPYGPLGRVDYARNIELINQLAVYARSCSAETYYAYPSIAEYFYWSSRDNLRLIDQKLRAEMEPEILGCLAESVFPDELCYDTPYHLNARGREIRTARLIKYLRLKLFPR